MSVEDLMAAPVALFAFRRPVHLSKTLEALACSPQATQTDVFAFVDAPSRSLDSPLVDEVCELLESYASGTAFRSVEIRRAAKPKGLAQSVIEGLSLVLAAHDRVIGIEDDIVLAPSGLEFLNAALVAYADAPSVWSVSAFAPAIVMPANYQESIFFTRRASSWGYATWRDRWERSVWEESHFQRLAASPRFRRQFALGGNDLPPMLDSQLAREIDSWAIRWCARQAELGALTVYPASSLVLNIGLDGSGTHSPSESVLPSTALDTWTQGPGTFSEPRLDPQVSRLFRKQYVSRTRLFLSKVWRLRHAFARRRNL